MPRPNDALITVEIVYATADCQPLISLRIKAGTTAAQAIAQCGISQEHPDLAEADIGIFGRPVLPDTVLREHDRIEIYRPLTNDPKRQRQTRARSSPKRQA